MHEGEVEEAALDRSQSTVLSGVDPLPGDRQGPSVACERARAAAIHVSGELVEQQDQGKTPARRGLPALDASLERLSDPIAEALRHLS